MTDAPKVDMLIFGYVGSETKKNVREMMIPQTPISPEQVGWQTADFKEDNGTQSFIPNKGSCLQRIPSYDKGCWMVCPRFSFLAADGPWQIRKTVIRSEALLSPARDDG